MNIRKGDLVIIKKGRDRGKTGKIIKIFPKNNKIIVESLHLVKKIKRAKRQGEKGEIISVPGPIDRSNVMIICPHCKKGTKIGYQINNKRKLRICKNCGSTIA